MSLITLCRNRLSTLSLKPAVLLAAFFFHVSLSNVLAQPCSEGIQNNHIEIKPAVCVGTVAQLLGSVPTGGNGSYTYQWEASDGNCGENSFEPISGATGKDYVVPENANPDACYRRLVISGTCEDYSNKTKLDAQTRTSPQPPETKAIQPTCSTPTGTIQVTDPAPATGIRYSIDGITYENTSGVFAELLPNVYGVTVKYSSGCISPAREVKIESLLTVTGTITPEKAVLCGSGGAAVTLQVSGGRSYQWYRNGEKLAGATGSTYQAGEPGRYTAEIFTESCQGQATNAAEVSEGSVPQGTITPEKAVLCGSGGAAVTLQVSGGRSYQWYRNGEKLAGATGSTYQAGEPGRYTAEISNGVCTALAANEVVVTKNVPIAFQLATTDPDCTTRTGSITIEDLSGGTGSSFFYSKDNGDSFQEKATFSELSPGSYKIVVKDSAGCRSETQTASIHSFTSTLKATASVINISCGQSTGAVTVSVTGGTAPYQFSMDGGAVQSSGEFTGLSLGVHKAVVKDAAGCSEDVSFTVIQIGSTLRAEATVQNATCNEQGALTIQASGGVLPYSYRLDGGDFQASASFANLSKGPHKVTVKDGLGCEFDVQAEIKQTSEKPNLIVTNPPKICPGSTVNLKEASLVSGSDVGLSYTYWKNTEASIAVADPSAVTAGTYYIKATNDAGCFVIKSVEVTVRTTATGSITASGPPFACVGQSILLTASSGQAYQWYRNDTALAGANASTYKATVEGVYSVVINDGACALPAFNTIKLQFQACISTPETNVFVPTAFTPNRNNANDVLRPLLYNIASLSYFKVYNRWGQLVFQTNAMGKGWDGTINGVPQPTETYTWILECTDNDGNRIKQSGRSLLIR